MKRAFAEIIADNFYEIQRNFKIGLKDTGYDYDEDLMNDAFISCNSALKDKPLEKEEAIKYYWTVYINKFKTKKTKETKHPMVYLDDLVDFDEPLDTVYRDEPDKIYDIIVEEIKKKYGEREAHIWELYVCHKVSIEDLHKMGFTDIENFPYFTKRIKRYILTHVVPENPELQYLLKIRKE
jgi:hypothetical protein